MEPLRTLSDNTNLQNPTCQLPFNPYSIGPSHELHLDSTSIIRFEQSGRVICPLCLQSLSLDQLKEVDINRFNQYVFDLFEGLNEHPENIQYRRVALAVLEIILTRRSINIKQETELQNLTKIIQKVKNSFRFNRFEFIQVAKIYSSLPTGFCSSNNYSPFSLIWNSSKDLLDYAKAQLINLPPELQASTEIEPLRFLETVATIVKNQLDLMGKYSFDQVSDMIFPLVKNDSSGDQPRKGYIRIQENCLEFVQEHLIPSCWEWLISFIRTPNSQELDTIREILATAGACFIVARRLKNQSYLKYIISLDIVKTTHKAMHMSSNETFRSPIRNFIRDYIKHYSEEEFESDELFTAIMSSGDSVETNYDKVMNYLGQNRRSHKILFYLIYNVIAYRQKSKYFNVIRLQRVLKLLKPHQLKMTKSRGMMRVYILLVSVVYPNIEGIDNIHRFLMDLWRKAPSLLILNEQFCFDEQVFLWAKKYPEFVRLLRMPTMNYMIKRAIGKGELIFFLARIFQDNLFRKMLLNYYEVSKTAMESIDEIITFEEKMDDDSTEVGRPQHLLIVKELSAILPNLLYKTILKMIEDPSKDLFKERALRLANMIVSLMDSSDKFLLIIDEQFLLDLFKALGNIYETSLSDPDVGLLVGINEFLTRIICSSNTCLMTMFKLLDYHIMGYMFHHLADYKKDDALAESIAKLLVAYDNCDFPLIQDISIKLFPMAPSALNWMLSPNEDLHNLSLRLCQKILGADLRTKTRCCLVTGLLHILSRDSNIFSEYANMTILRTLIYTEEFISHPMRTEMMEKLPPCIRYEYEQQLYGPDDGCECGPERPPSPSYSFTTIDSGRFEEDLATIRNFIPNLYDDDDIDESSLRQPGTHLTQDREHVWMDVDAWNPESSQRQDSQINIC